MPWKRHAHTLFVGFDIWYISSSVGSSSFLFLRGTGENNSSAQVFHKKGGFGTDLPNPLWSDRRLQQRHQWRSTWTFNFELWSIIASDPTDMKCTFFVFDFLFIKFNFLKYNLTQVPIKNLIFQSYRFHLCCFCFKRRIQAASAVLALT